MTRRPYASALHRRFVLLMLLVAALLARGLAPEGWMPVANAAGGISIAPCDGHGAIGMAMPKPNGKMHHNAPTKGKPGDAPCAFAGIGIADTNPPPSAIVTPARPVIAPRTVDRIAILPGRGPAAPPPPATPSRNARFTPT